MVGSLMSLGGYLIVLFVLSIWGVVKIWRSSPLLAILCFFFWPLSLIALIKYWGDEDSDIRIPFFLSLVVSVLIGFMAARTVNKGIDEMAYYLTDEEIAEVRLSDPGMADRLQAARDAAIAEHGDPWEGDEEGDSSEDESDARPRIKPRPASPASSNVAAPAPRPVEADPVAAEARVRAELAQAVQVLSWRFGNVDLAPAKAQLQMPTQFRLLPRIQALRVGTLRGTPVGNEVIGWLVHREVDLARDDAWYVEVRYLPLGTALAPPEDSKAPDAAQQQTYFATRVATTVDKTRSKHAQAAAWDATHGVASWHWPTPETEGHHDHVSARLVDGGLVTFTVARLHESHTELGLRTTRLAALRTTPAGTSAEVE